VIGPQIYAFSVGTISRKKKIRSQNSLGVGARSGIRDESK
jgi:hypothetical protein